MARTVSHGKVDVKHPDELWVSLNDFLNTLPSEGLLPESGLDLVEDLFVTGLAFVEDWRVLAQDTVQSYGTHHS